MTKLQVTVAELDRERARVVEEVGNMFADLPSLAAQNHARELIRPTPNAGRRGGTPEALARIQVGDVQGLLDRYYRPRNATLALAGSFDVAATRAAITALFAAIPAGEVVPAPGDPQPLDPPGARVISAQAVEVADPSVVSLAYAAPRPDDPLYAPFLVLVTRFWAGMSQIKGDDDEILFPVYFTPLDDGAILACTVLTKPGENEVAAVQRLETFVATTVAPPLGHDEAARTLQDLGAFFQTVSQPDKVLANNPYGVAFALARRQQLGIEATRFNEAIRSVTAESLRATADRFFRPRPARRGDREALNPGNIKSPASRAEVESRGLSSWASRGWSELRAGSPWQGGGLGLDSRRRSTRNRTARSGPSAGARGGHKPAPSQNGKEPHGCDGSRF